MLKFTYNGKIRKVRMDDMEVHPTYFKGYDTSVEGWRTFDLLKFIQENPMHYMAARVGEPVQNFMV